MTKNTILVALCIAMAVLATMTMAAPSATIKFVDDNLLPETTSLVDISLTGLTTTDAGSVFSFMSAPNPTATLPADLTLWKFRGFETQPTLEGYQQNSCFDITTGQIFGMVKYQSSSRFTIQFNYPDPGSFSSASFNTQAYYKVSDGTITSVTMRCYFPIDTDKKPNHFNVLVSDQLGSFQVNTDLAYPEKGVVHPQIDFKSASISRPIDDPISTSELKIEFTTDRPGVYGLTLSNAVSADPANLNNGKFADFFCSTGSNKKAFRIIYTGSNSPVLIMVSKDSLVNGSSIQCTILFHNDSSRRFVQSDRISVQLHFSDVTVTRNIDYIHATPGVKAGISMSGSDSSDPEIWIRSTDLSLSPATLKANSTIEFKFSSQIDVSFIQLSEGAGNDNSYRQNTNCVSSNIYATSFVDIKANSIILKDTSDSANSNLNCRFDFTTGAFAFKNQADLASVTVIINGVTLTSLLSPGTAVPLYLYTVGNVNALEHKETETETKVTVVDTFALQDMYEDNHQIMRDPVVAISLRGQLDFNFENYKDQVSCEVTSPNSSIYQKLVLNFDAERLVWTAKLKDLVSVEKYNILLKCTRDVKKIVKYSLDITPISRIRVRFINLIDGKRHNDYSSASAEMVSRSQPTEMASPAYPTAKAVGLFYHTSTVVLPDSWNSATLKTATTDFNTKVVDSMTAEQKEVWSNLKSVTSSVSFNTNYQDRYVNYLSLVDDFAYMIRNVKDTVVSYSFDYLSSFSNIVPSAGDLLDLYYSQSLTIGITTYFTADVTDATLVSVPVTSSIDFKKSLYDRKYRSEVVPYSTSNTENSNVDVIIPTDGCGYEKGHVFKTTQLPGFDFSNSGTTFADAQSKWLNWSQNFQNVQFFSFIGCQETEACTINADCESGLICMASKCTVMKQVLPPFVDISSQSDTAVSFDKDSFNSATMTSMVFAAVVAIVCTVIA